MLSWHPVPQTLAKGVPWKLELSRHELRSWSLPPLRITPCASYKMLNVKPEGSSSSLHAIAFPCFFFQDLTPLRCVATAVITSRHGWKASLPSQVLIFFQRGPGGWRSNNMPSSKSLWDLKARNVSSGFCRKRLQFNQ